jgi:hypothetical protein
MALITGKAVFLILFAVGAYAVSSYFGVVPQSIQDLVSWFDRNTTMLLFALVAGAVLYVYTKRKRTDEH